MEAVLTNDTFIVFAGLTLMFVTPWVAYFWQKVRVTEATCALKMEMLRRGMSAEEMLAVLRGPTAGAEAAREERVRKHRCRWG
jgi:hypothetical protein